MLQDETTRYQLVLQVRQDVYTGKLPCSWVTQVLLGSFFVQRFKRVTQHTRLHYHDENWIPENKDSAACSASNSTLNDRRQMHPPSQYVLNPQVTVDCRPVYTQQTLSETFNTLSLLVVVANT
uniref:FERM domain-containing protein n=1 Tax=Mesocestoides corti TaxID=53468 RepID=A0A5K3FUV5_MESCO